MATKDEHNCLDARTGLIGGGIESKPCSPAETLRAHLGRWHRCQGMKRCSLRMGAQNIKSLSTGEMGDDRRVTRCNLVGHSLKNRIRSGNHQQINLVRCFGELVPMTNRFPNRPTDSSQRKSQRTTSATRPDDADRVRTVHPGSASMGPTRCT